MKHERELCHDLIDQLVALKAMLDPDSDAFGYTGDAIVAVKMALGALGGR